MGEKSNSGRVNQRLRTRKDLLRAAGRLLKEGRKPTMDEVADAALVSRATAYRYFPSIEELLVEAPIDDATPAPEALFARDSSMDPADRADRAEAALHDMVYRNETQLRILLANSLEQSVGNRGEDPSPLRQNRRIPLIEAALAPARERFGETAYERLCAALALVFGIESMVVFRDVLPLNPDEARAVKSWAIRTLIRAALEESEPEI